MAAIISGVAIFSIGMKLLLKLTRTSPVSFALNSAFVRGRAVLLFARYLHGSCSTKTGKGTIRLYEAIPKSYGPLSIPMTILEWVILAKISITVLIWSTPLLLFPRSCFLKLGFPRPEPMIFIRLLGAAYGALVVGYAFGFVALHHGTHPHGVIWMGIISNGLACVILVILRKEWLAWGRCARLYMWSSTVATGGITALLFTFGIL